MLSLLNCSQCFHYILCCHDDHLTTAAGVILVGFFDNAALFCGSRDFVYSIEEGNQTAYCTLTGGLLDYNCMRVLEA